MHVEKYAYYVNKLRLRTWIWRRKKRTPDTNDRHMPLNETPPHENFLRTPLIDAECKFEDMVCAGKRCLVQVN